MIDAMAAKYGQRSLLIEHSAGRVAYTHILNLACWPMRHVNVFTLYPHVAARAKR
jgi:hypothetical protein